MTLISRNSILRILPFFNTLTCPILKLKTFPLSRPSKIFKFWSYPIIRFLHWANLRSCQLWRNWMWVIIGSLLFQDWVHYPFSSWIWAITLSLVIKLWLFWSYVRVVWRKSTCFSILSTRNARPCFSWPLSWSIWYGWITCQRANSSNSRRRRIVPIQWLTICWERTAKSCKVRL